MDLTTLRPATGDARSPGRRRDALIVVLLVGLLAGCATTATSAGSSPPASAVGPATSVAPPASAGVAPAPTTPGPVSGGPVSGGVASGPAATAQTVVIKTYLFVPDMVSVPAGATVMVDNQDGSNHTVTAADGSFDTGNLPGHTHAMFTAPSKPGSYPYKCAIHPFMKGTLTVT